MAEKFWFFNSAPGDPRIYQAQDFANYFGLVLTSGILAVKGQMGLQVESEGTDMQVYVEPGKAIIKGNAYENTANQFLTVDLPESTENRIDRIVLRHDLTNANRHIKVFVKRGTATEPPALQRDNFVYEISLARLTLEANTSSIDPANIIDERLDETLAGVVNSMITVPTSQFQEQWTEWFNNNVPVYEQEWQNWYETNIPGYEQQWKEFIDTLTGQSPVMSVNGQTPDVAGNVTVEIDTTTIEAEIDDLSEQIGVLSDLDTTDKTNLVNAVNELFTFANDGKTKWSSVIGSPLVSGDTFTQMQSKTQTIKDTLATNLTAKGQTSTGAEALQALANKVANITQSPFAGIPMQTQSGQGSYGSVRGVNTDGELYVQSSYTISRIKYGGTVLQTWTNRPLNTVWFCEERYCLTRSSPTGSQVYNAAGTLLYDSASNLYDNGSGSWGPGIMSYDGEVCYNIPNAGAWLYYLPKNGGVQSVSWSAYVLINPYIVYDKVAKTGRIIAFGGGSGAAPSRMVTQSGSTVSAPSMHINESVFFHTYKL